MEKTTLGITELVTRVGDSNIALQNLVENLTNCRSRHGGRESEVSFVTNPNFIDPNRVAANEFSHIGIVLWLPKAEVERAKREFHAQQATWESQP